MQAFSETYVDGGNSKDMQEFFVDHFHNEHEIDLLISSEGYQFFEEDGFRIEFKSSRSRFHIRLYAENENALHFVREGIEQHVIEAEPSRKGTIKWLGADFEIGKHPSNFHILTLRENRELFPGMQRLIAECEDSKTFDQPELHVRMMVPTNTSRAAVWPVMNANGSLEWPQGANTLHSRYMTVRNVNHETNRITIDVAQHECGHISKWSLEAAPGALIGVIGPAGSPNITNHQNILLVSDFTGLPAIARILERLPEGSNGDIVVALPPDSETALHYLPQTDLKLHTIAPDDFDASAPEEIRNLETVGEKSFAFFAGEFETAKTVRQIFKKELGLGKGDQLSVAYWRRGHDGYGG